jgi:hypothetical protein
MARKTTQQFIIDANKIHNNFYNYERVVYINSKTKVLIKCPKHGLFSQEPQSHLDGKGCRQCSIERTKVRCRLTLGKVKERCKSINLEFLDTHYINNTTLFKVKCNICGWEGFIALNSISRRLGCPKCSQGLGERICREYFEQIFKKSFPSCFPKWLGGLQLDGYNEELGIAFEHQGRQHYKIGSIFSKNKRIFKNIQKRDNIKKDLCIKNNIKLFIIPEIPLFTKINDIKDEIKNQSINLGIILPLDFNDIIIDTSKVYNPNDISRLNEQKIIAQSKNGVCLSNEWLGWSTKLLYKCDKNHEFWATPFNIKFNRKWCRKCSISKYRRKSVLQYDLQGNFIKKYESILEAEKKVGVGGITYCCKGERRSVGGFIWKYCVE